MKIQSEIINEIRNKADIVDVIGEYVNLKLAGRNWKGLCPFHKEKTPSFTVNREDSYFYCFGCKEGGNVFHFLQKHLNFTFYEAVKFLAERYHIKLAQDYSEQTNTLEQVIYKLYDISKEFYSEKLFSIGVNAMEYFQERKLTDEMIIKFELGYAPNTFDSLLKHLYLTQYEKNTILQSGLIKEKNDKYYDFFRDRAMFPIRDFIGRNIAFGGRTLNNLDKQYKYINSADSLIYDKKRTLFGLYEAKSEIRKLEEAIIVEGYIDVISLFKVGIKNVVAPCGTALTKEQLFSLKKHTNPKKIYLMFDGDTAGQNASIKAIQPALEAGFDLSIITLPPGKDPDSIVNDESGLELLEDCRKHSANFIEYLYRELNRQNKLSSPAEKAEAIRSFMKYIQCIPDQVEHKFYIDILEDIFGIRSSTLSNTFDKPSLQSDMQETVSALNTKEERPACLPAEKEVLHFALQNKQNFLYLVNNNVSENNFITQLAKDIFYFMMEYSDEESIFQAMLSTSDVSKDMKNIVSEIKIGNAKEKSKKWKEFSDETARYDAKVLIMIPLYQLRIEQINSELKIINNKLDLVLDEQLYDANNLLIAKRNALLQERMEMQNRISNN